MLHAVLDRFGALARGDEIARPFDAARDGMFACEGSFVAVLEDRLRARAGPDGIAYARVAGSAR